jgi:SAM-dependent methyltransferase
LARQARARLPQRPGTGDALTDDRWEGFAREDAEYYVLTDLGREPGAEARRAFFESGREQADRLLTECAPYLAGRELAIELGCGVGRIALPLSRHFGKLIAVDISPTMLVKLKENAARDAGAGHVEPMLAGASWDVADTADLVYSVLVFQHIDRLEDIARYVDRLSRTLKRGGIAYLQFDTRPRTLLYRVRNVLPDAVLPTPWRRGIRRIRRRPGSLRRLFNEHALEICNEVGPDSEYHAFIVRAT